MKGKQPSVEDGKPQVPAYIVTYSDMVTLLLTFFVLLLTLAQVRDPEMFRMGRDSFRQSIKLCGLGALLGSKVTMDLGNPQTKYPTTDPQSSANRTLDEYREKLRQVYERINQSAATLTSQLHAQRLDFSVVDVRFAKGQAVLDDSDTRSLLRFCIDVRQNASPETCRLYVLGLAGDETTEMQQWVLSAARAKAVAAFLEGQLNRGGPAHGAADRDTAASPTPRAPWEIVWWGAGPGGNWAGQDQPDPGQSQILIAVLKTGA